MNAYRDNRVFESDKKNIYIFENYEKCRGKCGRVRSFVVLRDMYSVLEQGKLHPTSMKN